MSAPTDSGIKIELPELNQKFSFDSPQELLDWSNQLRTEWQWLGGTPARRAWTQQESHLNQIRNAGNDWMGYPHNEDVRRRTEATVLSVARELFGVENLLLSNDAASAFIKESKEKYGQAEASGVYAALTSCVLQFENTVPEGFFSGLIRGFLFKNEIDWTASAHGKVLARLQATYKKQLADQETRLQQLEAANLKLNQAHDSTLTEKSAALEELKTTQTALFDELHKNKDEAFTNLASTHEANLKAIEETYNSKLALQKPVDYWNKKCRHHVELATRFAIASVITLIALGTGLSAVIYWAFGRLGENENPKHWQVGVTIVTAFFVVWVVRILVRLFLSHQHLASDASERVTMVQTYLSLSREGEAGVAVTDRTIILQQLFKSASDGIVKDDAAPPGFLELASRQK